MSSLQVHSFSLNLSEDEEKKEITIKDRTSYKINKSRRLSARRLDTDADNNRIQSIIILIDLQLNETVRITSINGRRGKRGGKKSRV